MCRVLACLHAYCQACACTRSSQVDQLHVALSELATDRVPCDCFVGIQFESADGVIQWAFCAAFGTLIRLQKYRDCKAVSHALVQMSLSVNVDAARSVLYHE